MRYSGIKSCDINNGDGLRVSFWTQGCPHKCKGCHNPETWCENGGKEFTKETLEMIMNELELGQNLSILGGEPLAEYNIKGVTNMVKKIKESIPNLNIWLWTGYVWEDIKHLEVIKDINVLIDGEYIEGLKCEGKHFGSNNQRIIDVEKSLGKKHIILYK